MQFCLCRDCGTFNQRESSNGILHLFKIDPHAEEDGLWHVVGAVDLEEIAQILQVSLATTSYDTLNSFVFSHYGEILKDGTQFEIQSHNLHIKVLKIKAHCIEEAIIYKEDMASIV